MPTERFYRLPEEKKSMIRQAAVNEFARVPIDKVSINQIIRQAGISRGSFYTYFEDKQDVLSYILEERSIQLQNFMWESLEKGGCGFWHMLESLFDRAVELFIGEERKNLIRNIVVQSGMREPDGYRKHSCMLLEEKELRKLYELCRERDMGTMDYQRFCALMQLVKYSFIGGIRQSTEEHSKENAREAFRLQMEILRRGTGTALQKTAETGADGI